MKIICIGRNYTGHARELGNEIPTEPVFFLKPDSAQLRGMDFYLPAFSEDIHYEAELVLKIGKTAKNITPDKALDCVAEMSVGIDFTARDLQSTLKSKGLPWEKAKAFDGSAAVGNFVNFVPEDAEAIRFSLRKNGECVQNACTSEMLFSIENILSEASKYFSLRKGDLIFTGTPSGVGSVKENDVLEGFLNDKKLLEVRVK